MAKLMETWDYYSLEEVPDIFKEAVKDTGYTMYDDEGNRLGNPYNKEDVRTLTLMKAAKRAICACRWTA